MTDPFPLRTPMIRPADELYRVDVSEQTQERLRLRSQRALPTSATTAGRREWRWGKPVDGPRTTSGPPQVFSPSDLEPGRGQDDSHTPSIRDVIARLKP
jgi:hypothetical protein